MKTKYKFCYQYKNKFLPIATISRSQNFATFIRGIFKFFISMLSSENEKSYAVQKKAAFILDSQLLFAECFACLLKTMNFFTTVLQSDHEEDLWRLLHSVSVSHIFLDYISSGHQATSIIQRVRNNYPDVKMVIVSATPNLFITQNLLKAGADALITKSTAVPDLANCLQAIGLGRNYLSPDIRLLMTEHGNQLHPVHFTEKEIQVLRFIANGFTIIKTAEKLNMSKHTVVAHRRNMMEKTGINSAPGLVKFGMDAGLLRA